MLLRRTLLLLAFACLPDKAQAQPAIEILSRSLVFEHPHADPYDLDNLAFMDGHVAFVRILKGLHVTPHYNVIPFKSLHGAAVECQEEKEAG